MALKGNLTEFQFDCIKIPWTEDTVADLCTYPKHFCDSVEGICKNCIDVCHHDKILRSCWDICRRAKDATSTVTTETLSTSTNNGNAGASWMSHEVWFFLSLFLVVALAVTVTLWLTQRMKYKFKLKRTLATILQFPVQDTDANNTMRVVRGPEKHSLLEDVIVTSTHLHRKSDFNEAEDKADSFEEVLE